MLGAGAGTERETFGAGRAGSTPFPVSLMTLDLVSLAGGLVLLLLGAEAFVRGAAALALRLGLSPLAVGLTVVAFGTSAPELVVSLNAALTGHGGLAVGNVVGSNIANLGLILGACVLLRAAAVERGLLRIHVPVMLAVSALLAALLIDGHLSRFDGAMLSLGMAAYLYTTLRPADGDDALPAEVDESSGAPAWKTGLMTVLGLTALVGGGHLLIGGAVGLAETLGVPEAIIGLTVVAIGTSLPELATSLVAAVRGHSDMAVGNVVGSNIFNVLGVLGISALVMPLSMGAVEPRDIAVMLAAAVLAAGLMWTGYRLARWEGAVLLGGYAAYLVAVL